MSLIDVLLITLSLSTIIFSALWIITVRRLKKCDLIFSQKLEKHKIIEEDLTVSKRELKGILDNLQDTYYRTNGDSVLQFVSSSVEPLLGYKPEELVVFGLDVTYRALARPAHRKALEDGTSRAGRFLAPLLSPLPDWNTDRLGADVLPQHDPCTIAWLIQPELFQLAPLNVEIETCSALTYGETVVDRWNYSGRVANVNWALDVDGDAVVDLIVERLSDLQ